MQDDAAESAQWHMRGKEGQCAIEGLLRGDREGRVGTVIAVWCGAQELSGAAINPLALESVTQRALVSTFPSDFHEQLERCRQKECPDKRKVSFKKPCQCL